MAMNVIEYSSVFKASKAFDQINSADCHSFQTYEVLAGIDRGLNRLTRIIRRNGPIRVFAVYDGGKPILLAPLRKMWSGEWVVAGTTEGYDYVDFVYGNGTEEQYSEVFRVLIDYLRSECSLKSLVWHFLDSRSRSWDYVAKYSITDKMEICNSEINLLYPTYEAYFSTLSKSVRQNVRTAYNRLRRNGHIVSYEIFCGALSDGDKEFVKCIDLYCRRQPKYRKVGWAMRQYIKHCHYMSTSVNSPEHYYCTLKIDGVVAGFMQGYMNPRRKAMEVPRLAIDEKFGWYSPGMILVNETIKWLIHTAGYEYLDLCRGCEKYKSDMGGEMYDTMNFKLKF